MNPLKKMKTELKELAAAIRAWNLACRQTSRSNSLWENEHPDWNKYGTALYKERWSRPYPTAVAPYADNQEYRNRHIAYCLVRGRTYEQIEPKVRDGNEPRWDKIDKIKAKLEADLKAYQEAYDAAQQALRAGA